jgi:hypothetical protein
LFNLNFNHSFNQTPIFSNQPELKVLFIKQFFSNHNHNSYHNTKHTRVNLTAWKTRAGLMVVFIFRWLLRPFFFLKKRIAPIYYLKHNPKQQQSLNSKPNILSWSVVKPNLNVSWSNFIFIQLWYFVYLWSCLIAL